MEPTFLLEDQNEVTDGRGIKPNVQGILYQLKFLLLCLSKSIQNNFSKFKLGTEIKKFDKFDDCVFEFEHNDTSKLYAIQIKHKLNPNKRHNQITTNNMFKEKDFNLLNYFKSYCKLDDKIKSRCNFVLCTNTKLCDDDIDLENMLYDIQNSEFLSDFKLLSNAKCYKLTDGAKQKLREFLRENQQVDQASLDKFVQTFTLVTDLLNEQDLGKCLQEELGSNISELMISPTSASNFNALIADKFESYVMDWIKSFENQEQTICRTINENELQSWVKNIVNDFNYLNIKAVSDNFQNEELQKYDLIEFNENGPCKEVEKIIVQNKIINIESKNIIISSKLILQVVKSMGKGFIILKLDTFLRESRNILNTFQDNDSIGIFIIVISNIKNIENIQTKIDTLVAILRNSNSKYVIFLSELKMKFIPSIKTLPYTFEFNQLKSSVRDNIMNRYVKLQGTEVLLKHILDETIANSVITGDILLDVLDNKLEIGSSSDFRHKTKESIYITRSISYPTTTLDKVLNLSDDFLNNNLVFIDNINLILNQSRGYEAKIKNIVEDIVDIEHSKIRSGIVGIRNLIHWSDWEKFKIEKSRQHLECMYLFEPMYNKEVESSLILKWKQLKVYFNGQHSIQVIAGIINEEPNQDHLCENDFIKVIDKQKIVLLSNSPGLGKSTLLGHLAEEIKHKHDDAWILRIDLNMHADKSKKFSLAEIDSHQNQMEFLIGMYLSNKTFKTNVAANLLKYNLVQKGNVCRPKISPRIFVFLDGFDEIVPSYKDATLSLIKSLINSDVSFLITTRHSEKCYLEQHLQTPAFSLDLLTETDQSKFIKKYLEIKWNNDNDLFTFDIKARIILNRHYIAQFNFRYTFFGCPLHLMMFCEMAIQDDSINLNNYMYDQVNMFDLFRNFLNGKWEQYWTEKGQSMEGNQVQETYNSIMRDLMMDAHRELSVKELFPEYELKLMTYESLKKSLSKQNRNVMDEISRVGLRNFHPVTKMSYSNHRSYAEYFLVEYLVNNIHEPEIVDLFKLFFSTYDHHSLARKFLSHKMKIKSNEFHNFVNVLEKIMTPSIFLYTVDINDNKLIEDILKKVCSTKDSLNNLLLDKNKEINTLFEAVNKGKKESVAAMLNFIKENSNYTSDSLQELLTYKSDFKDEPFVLYEEVEKALSTFIRLLGEVKKTRTEFLNIIYDFLLKEVHIKMFVQLNRGVIPTLKSLKMYYTEYKVEELIMRKLECYFHSTALLYGALYNYKENWIPLLRFLKDNIINDEILLSILNQRYDCNSTFLLRATSKFSEVDLKELLGILKNLFKPHVIKALVTVGDSNLRTILHEAAQPTTASVINLKTSIVVKWLKEVTTIEVTINLLQKKDRYDKHFLYYIKNNFNLFNEILDITDTEFVINLITTKDYRGETILQRYLKNPDSRKTLGFSLFDWLEENTDTNTILNLLKSQDKSGITLFQVVWEQDNDCKFDTKLDQLLKNGKYCYGFIKNILLIRNFEHKNIFNTLKRENRQKSYTCLLSRLKTIFYSDEYRSYVDGNSIPVNYDQVEELLQRHLNQQKEDDGEEATSIAELMVGV